MSGLKTPEYDANDVSDTNAAEVVNEDLSWLNGRLSELKEEGSIPSDEQENVEATSEEQGKQEEKKPTKEEFSPKLLRLMEKEAELRSKREAFEAEREAFKEKVQAVEEAARYAKEDQVQFLKALGVTSAEDLQKFAKAAYYASIGELAPEEFTREQQISQLKREIEELKYQTVGRQKEVQSQQAREQEFLGQYQQELAQTTGLVNEADQPYVATFMSDPSVGQKGVVEDMLFVADALARQTGEVPDARQVLAVLEQTYAERFPDKVKNVQATSQENVGSGRVIRNSSTQPQPTDEDINKYRGSYNDDDYAKVAALSRRKFEEFLKQQG